MPESGTGGSARPAVARNHLRGWHSRGYLPHYEMPDLVQHVTLHLADSLPREALERIKADMERVPPAERHAGKRRRIEEWVDAGHGCCVLGDPEIAATMREALLHFDGERYSLLAWVVMPNHMHALIRPSNGWTIPQIVAAWKKHVVYALVKRRQRGAAEEGSDESRNRTGSARERRLWQREYWDRYMRNENHMSETIEYIHMNPVKAQLVARPEDWPWSSAHLARPAGK